MKFLKILICCGKDSAQVKIKRPYSLGNDAIQNQVSDRPIRKSRDKTK